MKDKINGKRTPPERPEDDGVSEKIKKKARVERCDTPEIIRRNLFYRTNSKRFDEMGGESVMKPSDRNVLNPDPYKVNKWQDEFKIAIFSQEASKNFAKTFHSKIRRMDKTTNWYKSHEKKDFADMDKEIQRKLASGVEYSSDLNSYSEAFRTLFKNKEKPHVVAIVEGDRSQLEQKIQLNDENKTAYKLAKFFIQGKDQMGKNDDKQSMHFYVRSDMQKAVHFGEETINVPASDEFERKDSFVVGKVQFQTKVDTFNILIPHIPNKFIGTPEQCVETNDAIIQHGDDMTGTFVGYIGDTNFKSMMQANSSPSVGGNQGAKYIAPKSSGANDFTYFMQGVSADAGKSKFQVTQPSTLNFLNLKIPGSDVATDHPSIGMTVRIPNPIIGRKCKEADIMEDDTDDDTPSESYNGPKT